MGETHCIFLHPLSCFLLAFPSLPLCNSLSADNFLTNPMQAWLTWYEIITKNVSWLLGKPPAHRHGYLSVYKSMSWNDAPRVHRSSCAGGEGEELEISCNWKNKRDTCLKRLMLALPFHIKTCLQWRFLDFYAGSLWPWFIRVLKLIVHYYLNVCIYSSLFEIQF